MVYKQCPGPTVGHAGGQAVYRLIEHLRRRGHRVSLVARLHTGEETQLSALTALCDHVYTVPHHKDLSGARLLALARSYGALRQTAQRALRELRPDMLWVEMMQTAVVLLGLEGRRATLRVQDVNWFLFAQQAAEAQGWPRLRARGVSALLRLFEPWVMRRYACVATVSYGDAALLAPLKLPVITLPLEPSVFPQPTQRHRSLDGPCVLFVGAMDRSYNQEAVEWFLAQVWPRVRSAVPDAKFCIVGHAPPASLQARNGQDGVMVTGFVPDLAVWYARASVVVAPLRVAGGMLQKVLDAMAWGLPVVATSVSNHGIGATPAEHIELADTPEVFAAKVITLLRDPIRAEAMGRAAQAYVRERFDLAQAVITWERRMGLQKE